MTRAEEIADRFNSYLDRYSPPRHLANPKAQQAEVDALLMAILGYAPQMGYGEWLDRVCRELDRNAKTRAWPIVSEVNAACRAVTVARDTANRPAAPMASDVTLAAKAMNAGEAVGDHWLFGRRCVELIRTGEVMQDTLRRYRSAWYFHLKDTYGEVEARRMEAEALARHEAAERLGPLPTEAERAAMIRDERRAQEAARAGVRRMDEAVA
jgi:hypothetical protein